MTQIAWMGLALMGLAGCTAVSGPTYTVNTVNVPGQPIAYRVTCDGLLSSYESCTSAAARICNNREVVTLETIGTLSFQDDGSQRSPSQLLFRCGDPKASPTAQSDATAQPNATPTAPQAAAPVAAAAADNQSNTENATADSDAPAAAAATSAPVAESAATPAATPQPPANPSD